MNMEEKQENKLKSWILERIEVESPTPKMVFLTREYSVWSFWVLSVIIGAVAIAVMLFVGSHQQYALYEATHENLYTFMIEFLPYLWLATFALMTGLAVYNLRHTKRGYKYPVWQIATSSLVLSFAGGAALQFFGFGYFVDHELGEHVASYRSQEKLEMSLWQQPEEGRMTGVLTGSTTFTDVSGTNWNVDTVDLPSRDTALLLSDQPVRVLGTSTEGKFIICNVFPVLKEGQSLRSEFKEERQQFQERLQSIGTSLNRKVNLNHNTENVETPCHTLPMVKRIRIPK